MVTKPRHSTPVLLSLVLEVAEMCLALGGAVTHAGHNHFLKPMVLLEAYSDPSFLIFGWILWNLTTFIIWLPFIKRAYVLLVSVLLFLSFNKQNKIK